MSVVAPVAPPVNRSRRSGYGGSRWVSSYSASHLCPGELGGTSRRAHGREVSARSAAGSRADGRSRVGLLMRIGMTGGPLDASRPG